MRYKNERIKRVYEAEIKDKREYSQANALKKFFIFLRAKSRIMFRFCPNCNSDAPKKDDCWNCAQGRAKIKSKKAAYLIWRGWKESIIKYNDE